MTDRERAIIMAYTGVCMLEGERLNAFYKYLEELYGRPVYTHEWLTLDIKEKSRPDFIRLCKEEESEQKKGIMLEKKTWDEFRKTGLTLVINQILHIFGWVITYDVKDGKITNCYPSRTAFRGFDNDSISDSYIKISQWMRDNSEQLLKEAKDGEG